LVKPFSKRYFKVVNNKLRLIRKSWKSLRKLLCSGKISESTYNEVYKIIKNDKSFLEKKRWNMIEKIKLNLEELDTIINSLEILFAKTEVNYAAGEISKEIYERDKRILSSGIEALKKRLKEMKGLLESAMGALPLTKEDLEKILSKVPASKAFYFYTDYGNYTGRCAQSLEEFAKVIKNIEVQSIRFHLKRGDFQSWIRYLGDRELAKRIDSLRDIDLNDEELREKVYTYVEERVRELRKLLSIL